MSETSPTVADFEAIGVYDPNAPHAAQQLELLQYLVGLGANLDDLAAYRDELAGLASVVAIRGGHVLTLAEAAARSGLEEDKLLAISRAAGFTEPGRDDRVFAEQFADLAAGLTAAESVFGAGAVLQLVRVMGGAMARLADAIVSAFLVNVEPGISDEDPARLRVARANAEAAALLPTVTAGLEILLRQHLLSARRSSLGVDADSGYESRRMCVGFVDLVGSTALAQRMTTGELGSVLGEFERIATDTVRSGGGRVVKLIGDEILYTSADEPSACAIALELTATLAEHPTVPAARAGLASGDVTMRDGDVFGPVVNLAARAVKLAAPSDVVVPTAMARAARIPSEPLGRQTLKGFDGEVELSRLSRAGGRR
jgi:class 3 adenylate cyclase